MRMRREGLVPVGSGWGVRERVEDWMEEEIGLRCWESLVFETCGSRRGVDAHLFRRR